MVMVGPLPARSSVALAARSRAITYGSKVSLTSVLTGPGAVPLVGLPVDIQLLGRSGAWKTLHQLTSDGAGSSSTFVRLAYNHALRASFPGYPGFSTARSKPLAIGVRPRLTARLVPSTASVVTHGSRVVVSGAIKPAKHAFLMLVERLGPGPKKRVGRRLIRVRHGIGRGSFLFARAGSYQIRLATTPDAKNIGARSKAIPITVR
jgi:hypothetical protein